MNGEIPIGTIISWAKSIAGVPQTLPYGWALANGQTLSDTQSIFNGLVLPDLTQKFLRGNVTSGGTGGSETHTHNGSVNPTETVDNVQAGSDFFVADTTHDHTYTTNPTSTLPSYYEIVFLIRIK